MIKYEHMPELNRPILIEGLPGIGNVGKIACDFLCEKIDAKKFATIYSESFIEIFRYIYCILSCHTVNY